MSDSAGFGELRRFGGWETISVAYATAVPATRPTDRLAWAGCQDWMCEPAMLAASGRSVADH